MPGVASDLQSLILLVPMMRILPAELWRGFGPGLWVLAGLFVTASIRSLIGFAPVLDRVMLLGEALVGAGLYLWLTRAEKAEALGAIGRFGRLVRPVAAIGLVLLVAGAIANTIGLVAAAHVLVRATLPSAFVAVALYAAMRILVGVLSVLIRSNAAKKLRMLRDWGPLVRQRVLTVAYWAAAVFWAVTTLRLFRIADDLWRGAKALLGAHLEFGTISISLGDVVAFGATVWIASWLSRLLRFVLESDVLPHIALPRGVPNAISTGVHYAILLVGFTLAIGAAGIDLTKFTLLAGALGVGIGFGLQNVVNNFVSGLILLFERPVQTGDFVDVGGISGEVAHIGIRATTLRTPEGADVIVPNATFISERVMNWTLSERKRRVDVDVGVRYGTDPEKVIALLVATGRAHPEVLPIPEPLALLTRFGDNSLDFRLHVWTRFEIFVRVRSELTMAVNAALAGAGMEIPFPQRELHVKVEPGTPTYLLPETVERD
jgi:potassium efflux system protein